MTNDKELFDLCKKVYELTGWEMTDNFYFYAWTVNGHLLTDVTSKNFKSKNDKDIPLYDSDYLLEKLPEYVIEYDTYHEQDIRNYLCLMKVPEGYVALYDGLSLAHKVKVQRTDTPLKALLKLTISLSEHGVKL